MESLDRLDAARRGPFAYSHAGQVVYTPDPARLSWQQVLACIDAVILPGTPPMPWWKARYIQRAWVLHHDLPAFPQAQWLAYLVQKFHDQLEFDLQVRAGVDLGELWRARQWRRLLNIINHLPRDTHYAEALANDEEHARRVVEARARRAEGDDSAPEAASPPMHIWTPEVGLLADVIDAIRNVNHTLATANSPKGKGPKEPKPYPRPKTALSSLKRSVEHEVRQAKHESLVARLLPHKRA